MEKHPLSLSSSHPHPIFNWASPPAQCSSVLRPARLRLFGVRPSLLLLVVPSPPTPPLRTPRTSRRFVETLSGNSDIAPQGLDDIVLMVRIALEQEDDKPFTVRLSDESFETYELDPPPYTLETTKKELKQMYYDMVSIRYAPVMNTNTSRSYLTALFSNTDVWRWPPIVCTRRRRSGASATCRPVRKLSLSVSSTPSAVRTRSSQPTAATVSL